MSWFRLDGRGAFHFKVIAAGDEPYGAWCRAGQWSSDQLTDGFVPEETALLINRKAKVWARLCEVKLLEKVDGGYQIHDFLDFNPSSEQERARREETREKRRAAGKIGGKRSGEVRRGEADQKHEPGEGTKQTRSNDEANAKQSASTSLKQNEAPNPNPNPNPKIPEDTPLPPAVRGDGAPEVRQPAPEAPVPARASRAKSGALGLPGVGTEAADDVFAAHIAAWCRVVGKGSPPVLDDKRRRRVRRWVEQGVAVEQLKAAAAGIFDSDWHTAEENRGHLTFEVALRDAGQIEKFARLFADAETTRMPEARPTPKAPAWMSQAPRPRFRNLDILREADAAKAAGDPEDDPFAGLEDAMLRPEATDAH